MILAIKFLNMITVSVQQNYRLSFFPPKKGNYLTTCTFVTSYQNTNFFLVLVSFRRKNILNSHFFDFHEKLFILRPCVCVCVWGGVTEMFFFKSASISYIT